MCFNNFENCLYITRLKIAANHDRRKYKTNEDGNGSWIAVILLTFLPVNMNCFYFERVIYLQKINIYHCMNKLLKQLYPLFP